MYLLIGISVFVFTFGGMLRANARRWRYLAKSYLREESPPPIEERSWQSAVLLGLGGFNSLKGIVVIGAYPTGVSFRVFEPFALFHSPLFIPYGDIRGWNTSWYLDGASTELQFRGAPEVKMVVPSEQAEWIKGFAGRKLALHAESPPAGKSGQGWRTLLIAHAGLALVMLTWLLLYIFV